MNADINTREVLNNYIKYVSHFFAKIFKMFIVEFNISQFHI